MLSFLVRALAGALAILLGLELVLRQMPVNTGLRNQPVDAGQPVLRAVAHSPFVYSRGWNLRLVNHGLVNNDGFLSDADYAPGGHGIAIVGDSYVQGSAIATDRNLAAQLRRRIDHRDVFALGISGANLPDYVATVQWAVARYRPSAVVVVVTAGDVADAFASRQGGYRFDPEVGASCEPLLSPWAPSRSWPVTVLKQLRLTHYLTENLRAADQLKQAFTGAASPPSQPDAARLRSARLARAATCFADRLQAVAGGLPTLVVLHGRSAQDDDRDGLPGVLDRRGVPWVDLTPVFDAQARATGQRLDLLPTDSHWNELGHATAAEAVARWVRSLPAPLAADAGRTTGSPGR